MTPVPRAPAGAVCRRTGLPALCSRPGSRQAHPQGRPRPVPPVRGGRPGRAGGTRRHVEVVDMTEATLAEALEREHHEIDEGIEAFTADPSSGPARDRLRSAIRALRRHIYLEEEFAFPSLREAGFMMPIIVMLREHGQIWTTCDALEQALADGADNATLLRLCHQLTVQLQHHNLKEEKVLYPQIDVTMAPSALADLRAFLDSGQLPEGW